MVNLATALTSNAGEALRQNVSDWCISETPRGSHNRFQLHQSYFNHCTLHHLQKITSISVRLCSFHNGD